MAAPYAESCSRRNTPRRTSCSKSPRTDGLLLNHIVGDITIAPRLIATGGRCSTHLGVLPPSNVEPPEPAQKPDHLAHGRRHCLRGQAEEGAPSSSLRVLRPPDAAATEA